MKFISTFILLALGQFIAYAQKLPEIQTINVKVPDGYRADGKLNEWGNAFAAENKRTSLFYTLSNDDKAIYLAIKSANAEAVNKIMAGGISFSINTKGKKKEEESFTVTYPVIARNANRGAAQGQNRQRGLQNASGQTQQQRDSANLVQRKNQLAAIKEIKVAGFSTIPDSLISIYNEYGIKAKSTIDETGAYCYELVVPFSSLEIKVTEVKEIAYNIKLNGRVQNNAGRNNGGFGGAAGRNGGGANANNFNQQDLNSATDFWGKYALQRK